MKSLYPPWSRIGKYRYCCTHSGTLPWRKRSRGPLNMLVGPQSRSESFEEDINLLPILGFKPRTMKFLAYSFYWLRYPRSFLGAFVKNCEKRPLASPCPSVRPSIRMEQPDSNRTDFHKIWYECFSYTCRKNLSFIKLCDKNNGYLTWRPVDCTFVIIFRSILLRMRNVSDKCSSEIQIHISKVKTHVSRALTLSRKSLCLWKKV